MQIGVVADDITGANDIGIMFAKSDYVTYVYPYDGVLKKDYDDNPDVLVLDTNSRFDDSQVAYNKVYQATKVLKEEGYNQFYNKTCSVFRGNIGREFDAMLDVLHEEFAIVVLGFPKNGRITKRGIHYVHGRKLEESEFRNDPMHPMTRSDLVEILQAQTKRKVENIPYEVIRLGVDGLKAKINEMKDRCNYLILDVEDQQSLRIIAEAVSKERIICGSSALAEELPKVWNKRISREADANIPSVQNLGILCTAGSLMPQTAAQIQYLKEKGTKTLELNTLKLFERKEREREINQIIHTSLAMITEGKDILLYSSNHPDKVSATKQVGYQKGLSNTDVARLVSTSIGEIVVKIVKKTKLNRIVIAGGDTSASVCSMLGVNGLRVWKEIQPGLPSCITISDEPLFLVLKSGSFGKGDFFEKAIEHLKKQ